MPTIDYQLNGTPNEFGQAQTITKTFTLPEDFTGVNVITATPDVDPSKISYTISGREITITLSSVYPSHGQNEYAYAYLISEQLQPGEDNVYRCTYDDGSSMYAVNACPVTRSKQVRMYYYDYTVTLDYIANIPPVARINGQTREVEGVFARVNGTVREIEGTWMRVNGALKKM